MIENSKELAVREIAAKIEQMQAIYEDAVDLAQLYNIRIMHTFTPPVGTPDGHNACQSGLNWSASASYC